LVDVIAWAWDVDRREYVPLGTGLLGPRWPAGEVAPYQGVWVRGHADGLALRIPAPEGTEGDGRGRKGTEGDGRGPTRTSGSADSWTVNLTAVAGLLRDAGNFFGVSAGTSGWQVESPPRPVGDGFVDLFFTTAEGRALAMDLRPGVGNGRRAVPSTNPKWPVMVVTDQPQTPVTVTWDDLTGVPQGYHLWLVDPTAGVRRAMNTTRHYTFRTGSEAITRRSLEIEVTVGDAGTLILSNVQVRATDRGSEVALEITGTLNRPAEVEVEVRSLAGRPVVTLPAQPGRAGINTWAWPRRDAEGRPVPPGIYLVEIRAQDETGVPARAVRSVTVP
jgi:hypothetical protein